MVYGLNRRGNQSGVYAQHKRYWESKNNSRDPLEAFDKDLEKMIGDHQKDGESIILMGDFNTDVRKDTINKMGERRNTRDIITTRHGNQGPGTYNRNTKRKPVDGIFGSNSLESKKNATWALVME